MNRTHAPAPRLNSRQLTLILLLFGFSTVSYFDRIIMPAAGPRLMRDFSISPTAMGSVYSAFILGYALLMIPGGHLSDRLGARRTLALMAFGSAGFTALTVLAGSSLISAWVGTVAILWVIRFGMGIVTAPLYPACACATGDWIPAVYHARVQGFIIGGSSLGAAIAPVFFTWLLGRFEWRTPFLLAAVVPAVLSVVWLSFARDKATPRRDEGALVTAPKSAPWLALFTDRNLMLVTYAYGALGYFQYIFFFWMNYYFAEVLHLGEVGSARYTAIMFLVEGAMMPLGGFVSDRLAKTYGQQFGRRWVPIAGLSLGAAFCCAGTVSGGVLAVACFSFAFGLAACCEGPFWATVTEMAGDHVGSASSILNTGAQVGGFFAPVLTPMIAERFGWSWGLYAGVLVVLTGVAALYLVKMQPGPTRGISARLAVFSD